MSTYYVPRKPIPFSQIKGISTGVVSEKQAEDTTADNACLTDGDNCLWANKSEHGNTTFARYGMNDESVIISELERHFGTELVSEHDSDFNTIVDQEYREEYVSIQLPTPENPGPWRRVG